MSAAISALQNIFCMETADDYHVLPPPYCRMFRLWAHFSDKAIDKAVCNDLHSYSDTLAVPGYTPLPLALCFTQFLEATLQTWFLGSRVHTARPARARAHELRASAEDEVEVEVVLLEALRRAVRAFDPSSELRIECTFGGVRSGRLTAHSLSNISEANAIMYALCIRACGTSPEPFDWPACYQQFSSWLLPYFALLSQLPFGAESPLSNLSSVLLTIGSPTLAAYSLALTALNRRWVTRRFRTFSYLNAQHAAATLGDLQGVPVRIAYEDGQLPSLVVLHQHVRPSRAGSPLNSLRDTLANPAPMSRWQNSRLCAPIFDYARVFSWSATAEDIAAAFASVSRKARARIPYPGSPRPSPFPCPETVEAQVWPYLPTQIDEPAPSPEAVLLKSSSTHENLGSTEDDDAEFAKELAKLVTDTSGDARKVDKKTVLALRDTALPPPVTRQIAIPAESALAVQTRTAQMQDKVEQQHLKRLLLKYEQHEEVEELKALEERRRQGPIKRCEKVLCSHGRQRLPTSPDESDADDDRPRDYNQPGTKVVRTTFHHGSNLVVGFSTGVFGLWEMPAFSNIHTFNISQEKISSVVIDLSGEWLTFGAQELGQLLVWEWQSESCLVFAQELLTPDEFDVIHRYFSVCTSNPDQLTLLLSTHTKHLTLLPSNPPLHRKMERRFPKKDAQVLTSLFRLHGEARCDFTWEEFAHAMGRLGFDYGPASKRKGSGSKKAFEAPKELGNRKMRLDKPHRGREDIYRSSDQTDLANRLEEHFPGIREYVIAKLPPRPQPQPQPEPEPEPEPEREPEREPEA
ncbi:hypothetical protein L226DRAFT_567720 [Lentinus tigrinus ALCF2SS1-7]|uniref:uncharacterized protein n=1 Tax=Lentinus tigrinus ALCF2SS1-7 TaxID=1328758 RepID=UPI0011663D9A|nr:hypothetical protein L226DRAFT_567720 [Lentinus tigrinus ALCF2SS1-7]